MTDTSNNEHSAVPHTREEEEHDPEFREQDNSPHDAETEEDTASGGAPEPPSDDSDDEGEKSAEWERPEELGQPPADGLR